MINTSAFTLLHSRSSLAAICTCSAESALVQLSVSSCQDVPDQADLVARCCALTMICADLPYSGKALAMEGIYKRR